MPKLVPYEENHRLNDNGELEKLCNKHYIYFPEESPWFPCNDKYFNKNPTNTKDGLNGLCKKCLSKNSKKYNKPKKPKNKIPERLQQTYSNMKGRCYNPKTNGYKYYGGKGITVCDEWLKDSKKFYTWALNNGYEDNLTIDRIENDGNYEPDNCRWATHKEQQNNKTNTIYIEYDNEIKPLTQWSEETGIKSYTIKNRSEKGKDILEDQHFIKINMEGEIKTMKELSEEYNIPYYVIQDRYHKGLEGNELIKDLEPRETKHVEINGEIHTITEWAEISGLTREIIINRIAYGWNINDLLKPRTRVGRRKYIEINGVSRMVDEWCSIAGISKVTWYERVKKGFKGNDLLAPAK